MARRLRMYHHPVLAQLKANPDAQASRDASNFIRNVPRNVSPISHVIIPQVSGLDPNAHLTPLKGYRIRFKGKILDKTLRSNLFKFRTGHTRKSDFRSHHLEEGYAVHGPFGVVGIRVYYEYELEPYFGSTEVYVEEEGTESKSTGKMSESGAREKSEKDKYKYKISDSKHDVRYLDEHEDERTQQLLLDSESEL